MKYTLYNDDCLHVLDAIGPVDAVVTDPVWPNAPDGMFDVEPYDVLKGALSLIDAKRLVIILRYDSDPRILCAVPSKWEFFRTQVLTYSVPGYKGRKLGGMEIAYCFGEPIPRMEGQIVIPGESPRAGTGQTRGINHPCPRALSHMTWLLRWWSMPGETVLDPFMGSGTTGVAAAGRGANFIGVEKSPEFFEVAKNRVSNAYGNYLPTDEDVRVGQMVLY